MRLQPLPRQIQRSQHGVGRAGGTEQSHRPLCAGGVARVADVQPCAAGQDAERLVGRVGGDGRAEAQRVQHGPREHQVRAVGAVHQQRNAVRPARGGDRPEVHQAAVVIRGRHIDGGKAGAGRRLRHAAGQSPDRLQPQQGHGVYGAPVNHAGAEDLAPVRGRKAQHGLDAERAAARGKAGARRAEQRRGFALRFQNRSGGIVQAVRVGQLRKIERHQTARQGGGAALMPRRMKRGAAPLSVAHKRRVKRRAPVFRQPVPLFWEAHPETCSGRSSS